MDVLPEFSNRERNLIKTIKLGVYVPFALGFLTVIGAALYSPIKKKLDDFRYVGAEHSLNTKSNECYVSATNFLNQAGIKIKEGDLESVMGQVKDFRLDNMGSGFDARLNGGLGKAFYQYEEYKKACEKLESLEKK